MTPAMALPNCGGPLVVVVDPPPPPEPGEEPPPPPPAIEARADMETDRLVLGGW